MPIYKCKICDKEFKVTRGVSHTCSLHCRHQAALNYQLQYRKKSVTNTLRTIVAGCKSRANRKNLECDITIEFILYLLEKQKGRCAVTNVILEPTAAINRNGYKPNTVSVDRIDSLKGYTKDNVRLVTTIYNTAKNMWTDNDVLEMCKELCHARLGGC